MHGAGRLYTKDKDTSVLFVAATICGWECYVLLESIPTTVFISVGVEPHTIQTGQTGQTQVTLCQCETSYGPFSC